MATDCEIYHNRSDELPYQLSQDRSANVHAYIVKRLVPAEISHPKVSQHRRDIAHPLLKGCIRSTLQPIFTKLSSYPGLVGGKTKALHSEHEQVSLNTGSNLRRSPDVPTRRHQF
jgi:hypothetical protein